MDKSSLFYSILFCLKAVSVSPWRTWSWAASPSRSSLPGTETAWPAPSLDLHPDASSCRRRCLRPQSGPARLRTNTHTHRWKSDPRGEHATPSSQRRQRRSALKLPGWSQRLQRWGWTDSDQFLQHLCCRSRSLNQHHGMMTLDALRSSSTKLLRKSQKQIFLHNCVIRIQIFFFWVSKLTWL